jgi:hypothetical protein
VLGRKIKDTLFDNVDLEKANQEIGYLKDICDNKDLVISYQKELLNIQSESIKRFRKIEEELNNLKEEIKNDNTRNKARK